MEVAMVAWLLMLCTVLGYAPPLMRAQAIGNSTSKSLSAAVAQQLHAAFAANTSSAIVAPLTYSIPLNFFNASLINLNTTYGADAAGANTTNSTIFGTRRLLAGGTVALQAGFESISGPRYISPMRIGGAPPAPLQAGAGNGFLMVFDSGSIDLLVQLRITGLLPNTFPSPPNAPNGFNVAGLTASNPGLGLGPAVIPFSFAAGTFLGVELSGQFQIGGSKVATNQKFAVVGQAVTANDPFGIPFFPGGTKVNLFSPGGGSQGILGLGFKDGENIGDNVPAVINMFQQGVIPLPMFSVFLTSPSPPLKLASAFPTASEIVLGGVSSKINPSLDLVCANLVAPPAVAPDDWTVGLQGVSSSVAGQLPLTSTLCSVSTPCTVLLDTGNPGISVPRLALLEIAAAIGAIIDQVTGLMLLPSCVTLPTLPTFTFRIADHEYSIGPNDYIRQFTIAPTTNFPTGQLCVAAFSQSAASEWALGDPFIGLFPTMHFFPPAAPSICFSGTVPVKANCKVPAVPVVTDNLKESVVLTEAQLVALVNAESALLVTPPTVFTILAPTPNGLGSSDYKFYAGETYAITLQASNSVSSDTCVATITVGLDPNSKAQNIKKAIFP